jgi:hypothetical protein
MQPRAVLEIMVSLSFPEFRKVRAFLNACFLPGLPPSSAVALTKTEALAKADLSRRSFNEGGSSGLLKGRKAKPDANTRTLRPDKCLAVSSLSPGLRLTPPATLASMMTPPGRDLRQIRRFRCYG